MAGVFQKAKVWLGLAPDEEYDDYPYEPVPRPMPRQAPRQGPAPRPRPAPQGQQRPAVRPQRPVAMPPEGPDEYYEDEGYVSPRGAPRPSGSVRPLPTRGPLQNDPRAVRGEETPTVRPMRPTSAKPSILTPASFDDAKEIADRFKANQPVVMDLASVDRELARRLIDFASGITYALGGSMERVRAGGYLLAPPHVEVSDEERRRLSDGGR